MDLTRDFAEYLAEMAENSIITDPDTGDKFNGKTLARITRRKLEPIHTFNLSALVKAVCAILQTKTPLDLPLWVKVNNAKQVVVSTTADAQRVSDDVIIAELDKNVADGVTERFVDYESFMIRLSSRFVESEALDALRKMLASITSIDEDSVSDDGISQRATMRSGVSLKQEGEIKAKFNLAPFRTFLEISQPESPYLLRVKPDKEIGLFIADGGLWEYEAVQRIRTWLDKALGDLIKDGKVVLV